MYTNSVLASLNSRRALALKFNGDGAFTDFEPGRPASHIANASRHIEFSGTSELQSRELGDGENDNKVIMIECCIHFALT